MTWHFTVDDRVAIQSLPLNIQGEHADHDGPGNRRSIAIEICEFRNARQQAAAHRPRRAAHRVADAAPGIPLSNVVPALPLAAAPFSATTKRTARASCSSGGRPGPRWQAFLRKVSGYY